MLSRKPLPIRRGMSVSAPRGNSSWAASRFPTAQKARSRDGWPTAATTPAAHSSRLALPPSKSACRTSIAGPRSLSRAILLRECSSKPPSSCIRPTASRRRSRFSKNRSLPIPKMRMPPTRWPCSKPSSATPHGRSNSCAPPFRWPRISAAPGITSASRKPPTETCQPPPRRWRKRNLSCRRARTRPLRWPQCSCG